MKLGLATMFVSFALAFAAPAAAQAPPKALFAANDAIRLVIQAPLQQLIRNRENSSPIAGTLIDPGGQSLPITLALRGITRRTADICDFPPLRVVFTQPPPANSLFAGQKKLKLVTHCRSDGSFQQHLLLEYCAYRMYNLLTPRSFRARLASIEYRGADGRPIIARYGYFLEDLSDVARRNGTRVVHAGERIPVTYLNAADAGRYAVFQHMIGNHDWSMRAGPAGSDCCHNAELIGAAAPGATMPIPYDFDFSGLVSAPYATAPDELKISDVHQRFYRGYCVHNAGAAAAAAQMRAAQAAILGTLGEVPLDNRARGKAASYLGGFFSLIATDADVSDKILKRCLGFNP